MDKKTMLAGVLGLGLLGLGGVLAHPGHDPAAHVDLRDGRGRTVARVDITPLPRGGNRVSVSAWNLTPGFHGMHLSAVGACEPSGIAGTSPAEVFPALLAGPDGRAEATFTDGAFTLRDLYTAAGTAIVIDNGACGVVAGPRGPAVQPPIRDAGRLPVALKPD